MKVLPVHILIPVINKKILILKTSVPMFVPVLKKSSSTLLFSSSLYNEENIF